KQQKQIERNKKENQERKRKEQQGNDTKYKKVETNNETINGGNNKKQSVLGIIKEHPVISAMVAATEFVLTPLLIFKNKIIDGVKNIFGKNQNQKFVAKRIKTSN
ncbi:MAG: hypothetical protein Q4B84_01160, partial [Clostridia bacterium]|nr:hypothetical protein [Clostridia bacterium]